MIQASITGTTQTQGQTLTRAQRREQARAQAQASQASESTQTQASAGAGPGSESTQGSESTGTQAQAGAGESTGAGAGASESTQGADTGTTQGAGAGTGTQASESAPAQGAGTQAQAGESESTGTQGAGLPGSESESEGSESTGAPKLDTTPDTQANAGRALSFPRWVAHSSRWTYNAARGVRVEGAPGGLILSRSQVDADRDAQTPGTHQTPAHLCNGERVSVFIAGADPDTFALALACAGVDIVGGSGPAPIDERATIQDIRDMLPALKNPRQSALFMAPAQALVSSLKGDKGRADALALIQRAGKGDKSGVCATLGAFALTAWGQTPAPAQGAGESTGTTQGAGAGTGTQASAGAPSLVPA